MEENLSFSQIDVEGTEAERMTVNFYRSQIARRSRSPQSSTTLVPSSLNRVVNSRMFCSRRLDYHNIYVIFLFVFYFQIDLPLFHYVLQEIREI